MTKNISLINFQLDLATNSAQMMPRGAYIHVPFCRRRCYYCDFPISVVGDRGGSTSGMVEEYLTALVREIKLAPTTDRSLQTVFFGGGTPSLFSPPQIQQVIKAIARFGIAENAEISMEIDPGTFDRDRLVGYLAAGVNRFSLGVQTFDEELLKICGRSHTLAEVMQAISIIQQLNIDNFSLDLISGLPHQTLQHCQTSLERAIAIAPKHLSCYDLVLEPVTAFGKQYQPGETPLPSDKDAAAMYRLTQQMLTTAGYEHYEISNYGRSGYQCRHNLVYWHNQPFYGFGMGAASYVGGIRFARPRTRREYYAWLSDGALVDAPLLTDTDRLLETLMLGLRLRQGIALEQFEKQIVEKIITCLKPYFVRGWVELTQADRLVDWNRHLPQTNSLRLRLNDPEGFLFSNTILATLFEELE